MGRKVENWRVVFDDVITSIRAKPHEWGSHDCLSGLVVPVVRALTGQRKFGKYLKRYKTARGALGVMKRAGFKNLADLVASELEEIHPSQCVIGDIVAIATKDEFGYALGVVNGDRAFVLHENGLGTRDLLEAKRAFRVN